MARNLKSNMLHKVNTMYHQGYGKKASERREMRERNQRTITMKNTKEMTERAAKDFCAWMREEGRKNVRSFEEAGKYVEQYRDHLMTKGHSQATVHTYIDRVNQVLGTHVTTSRAGATPEKGRDKKLDVAIRNDAQRSYSPRLSNFAAATGLRRAEYQNLQYGQIKPYKDTYKIEVIGKGGKYQEQIILPQHKGVIETILAEPHKPDDRVFSRREMTNKINLHEIRREVAREAHQYYLELVKDPEQAEKLYQQIKETYISRNPDKALPRDFQLLEKNGLDDKYVTRGAVKADLESKGLPTEYNRLATLATSVNHLSHWRCDVTIQNYYR